MARGGDSRRPAWQFEVFEVMEELGHVVRRRSVVPYPNILHLIGNTPLVELRTFDAGECKLFVKLESQNPGGSIKDRIGRSMIEVAEREGKIGPNSVLVEATAGNTGLGLALVAAQKGYRLILVIPDKMSQEKVLHLKALGAEVVMTRSDVGKGQASLQRSPQAGRIA
jgi:cystathionine beta-synthase